MCLRGFGDGVEQQMMRIKILAAHIPVRLLGLGIKIAQIGQRLRSTTRRTLHAPCGEHWFRLDLILLCSYQRSLSPMTKSSDPK